MQRIISDHNPDRHQNLITSEKETNKKRARELTSEHNL